MPLYRNPAVDNRVCDGRLTLTSGNPFNTSDETAQATVYFTPYAGNRIALYNGIYWELKNFSEVSVAVPATLFRLFDIFVYDNAGTITLETVNWNQSTGSITAATAAAECQITSTAHGRSNGEIIGIAGVVGTLGTNTNNGINGKVWACRNVAANTIDLDGSDTTGLTYTSGGTWYHIPNTRATAITLQDGVYVQSGATNKRYLGTCMTTSTSGQCENSVTRRLVWNYYNRLPQRFYKVESASSWIYSTATYRPMNNNTTNRVEMVVGVAESYFAGQTAGKFESTVAANGELRLADNNVDNVMTATPTHAVTNATAFANIQSNYVYALSSGYHFLQIDERGFGAGTQTFYGENSAGVSGAFWS